MTDGWRKNWENHCRGHECHGTGAAQTSALTTSTFSSVLHPTLEWSLREIWILIWIWKRDVDDDHDDWLNHLGGVGSYSVDIKVMPKSQELLCACGISRAEEPLLYSQLVIFEAQYFLHQRWVTLTSCFTVKPLRRLTPVYGDKNQLMIQTLLHFKKKTKTNCQCKSNKESNSFVLHLLKTQKASSSGTRHAYRV